jgi:N-methylhydantoinase B
MTNTLNTPVEALEFAYPFLVRRYAIREGSGGEGQHFGGDGMVREIQLNSPAQASLLSDRRTTRPYGLNGGESGKPGENILLRAGEEQHLPGKGTFDLQAGDILSIRTPGGGGFGKKRSVE